MASQSSEVFVIPAEYGLALFDSAAYVSFVAAEWTFPQLRTHIVREMGQRHIVAWGTGASGNWRVEVATEATERKGFREFTTRIRAAGKRLHLTSYDELTWAAQFENTQLPRPGTENWSVTVVPGEYDCRVVQLYDPTEAESEAVFAQVTAHFAIELSPAKGKVRRAVKSIPWFPAE